MLHVLRLAVLMGLAGVASAQPSTAAQKDTYREPTAAELSKQQQLIENGMKDGESYYQSQPFKDLLQDMRQRAAVVPNTLPGNKLELPSDVENQRWADRFNDLENQANKAPHAPIGSNAPMVFVSFSLPEATIKTLAAEAAKIGGVLVFRGLKNDDFRVMRQALAGLGEGFAIDPTLFQRFKISDVPVFVVPVDPVLPCNDSGCQNGRFVKLAGNVTLDAALDYMSIHTQDADAKKLSNDLLMRLREK